jgi:hypothetical protein
MTVLKLTCDFGNFSSFSSLSFVQYFLADYFRNIFITGMNGYEKCSIFNFYESESNVR